MAAERQGESSDSGSPFISVILEFLDLHIVPDLEADLELRSNGKAAPAMCLHMASTAVC